MSFLSMSNASSPNQGVKWGLIAGAVGVAAGLIFYFTNPVKLQTLLFGAIELAATAVCALMAGLERRKANGGSIEFKPVLQPIFTTFVISMLIGVIFTYVMFNYVDPSLVVQMKQAHIADVRDNPGLYKALGYTEDQYKAELKQAETGEYGVTFAGSVITYLQKLIKSFILSAILSLIVRRK